MFLKISISKKYYLHLDVFGIIFPIMETNINSQLLSAIVKLLRPLVRILLRYGISYGTFADLIKWVYVEVASKEFQISGRKQSKSRVSIITGLSRKEVLKLKSMDMPFDNETTKRYNRAARVISGWIRDPKFKGKNGKTRALAFDDSEDSFSNLVKTYSGDVPVRALFDELKSVNAIKVNENGTISLVTKGYTPSEDVAAKLDILGNDVGDLIATINHNIQNNDKPFFQRKVSYDNIPVEAVEKFRQLSAEDSQELLEKMDNFLAKHDRDTNSKSGGTGKKRVGIGIYFFEEDLENSNNNNEESGG
jgi:hypothetical protein